MFILLPHATYQQEFASFAAEERRGSLPAQPVLFYGSSSFRLWTTLEHDFPGLPVLNRGFGGSTLDECLAHFQQWVVPLAPRALVLYAGDNDVDHGAAPEVVLARFEQFQRLVLEHLGPTPLLFIAIKPSPARFWNAAKITRANALVAQSIASRPETTRFIDIYPAMLNHHGAPRRELFAGDGLHLSPPGYAVWQKAISASLAELGLHGEPRVS